MQQTSQKLDPARLKSFVRNVCIVAKKHKDREDAHSDLQKHIRGLKKFSSKKKEMDKQLKDLNSKVSLVLEKERQLLGVEQGESYALKDIMDNMTANKWKMEQMKASINDLKAKLNEYIEIKTAREKRINELEAKIRAKTQKKENVSALKVQLSKLEATYKKFKKQGVDVSGIEDRIDDLRLRLG